MTRIFARSIGMTRVAAGLLAAIPALLLALVAVASMAYFVEFLRPLATSVDSLLPIDPGDGGPAVAILSAVGLGALSVGLLNGKAVSWWLAVATFAVALLSQAVTLQRPVGDIAVGGLLAVLLADRRRYRVDTDAGWRRHLPALLLVAGILVGLQTSLTIAATGTWPPPFVALGDVTTAIGNAFGISDDLASNILGITSHNVFLALLVVVARLPLVLAAIGVLTHVPEPAADPSSRDRARVIGRRFGRGALLPFQLGDDKLVFSPADADGVIVYGVAGGTAVVLGDPIGRETDSARVLAAFLTRCRKLGRPVVFYQSSSSGRTALIDAGYRPFRVGREAILELGEFDLAGARRANLRHTITRCRRAGVSVRWLPRGIDAAAEPDLVGQLRLIDQTWRKRMGPAMGFTVGRFEESSLRWQAIALAVGPDGRALGFATFRPTGSDGGWVLDLIRRTPDSPPGVVEFCIAEAAAALRTAGDPTLSLGLAPLSGLEGAGSAEERLLAIGARLVRHWYDVEGLAFFKGKFDPVWLPRYGAIRHRRDLGRFVISLLLVHVRVKAVLSRHGATGSEAVTWSAE